MRRSRSSGRQSSSGEASTDPVTVSGAAGPPVDSFAQGTSAHTIPIFAAVIGLGTVFFTLVSHISQGRDPQVPTISLTAFRPGSLESFTFTIGLCCAASLLIMTGFILSWRFPSKGLLARASFWSGNIAAAGLAITCAVPLQENILDILNQPRDKREFTVQSNIHTVAANTFFLGSLLHAILYTLHLRSVGAADQTSLKLKYATILLSCCFILSPLLLTMYPSIIKGSRMSVVAFNQYGAIISLLCFFATYTIDLRGYKIMLEKNAPIKVK